MLSILKYSIIFLDPNTHFVLYYHSLYIRKFAKNEIAKMKKILLSTVLAIGTLLGQSQQIDLAWARSTGGTGSDRLASIALDASGNVYEVGIFQDTILNSGSASDLISNGSFDIFIQKLDNSGNLLWSKSIGGIGYEFVSSIQIDNVGDVYIAGNFRDTVDFDPDAGVYNLISKGDRDVFVQKLDANGSFIWVKAIGGIGIESVSELALDASSNVFIAGTFQSGVDFDPGAGVVNLPYGGGFYDCFIEKLDVNGNFVWVNSIGGNGQDNLEALNVDNLGNIYTAGVFADTVDFDPGAGVNNLIAPTGRNIFIQKLDNTGAFTWAKSIGGAGSTHVNSLGVDDVGNVYLLGGFRDTIDFDPGVGIHNLVANGMGIDGPVNDIFIEKLDVNGNFIWVKAISGNSDKYGYSLSVDNLNNLYISCSFSDTLDVDPSTAVQNIISNGDEDAFVEKFDNNGNFSWIKSIGGKESDFAVDIVTDDLGDVYVAGAFRDTVDCDPGVGIVNLISKGNRDGFTMKLEVEKPVIKGIDENGNDNIVIYPNPTHGMVNVVYSKIIKKVEVIDVTGSIKLQVSSNTIDLSTLNAGIYFLKISTDKGIDVKKLVKK